ncbi:MAG: FecR family protein [Mariprofundales bacterium]
MDGIGTIKTMVQPAWFVRASVKNIATTGQVVTAGDTLKTGDDGAIGVLFNDDTLISLGANSEYQLDDYVYKPKEGKFSFISTVVSGTLEFISGKITKMSPDSVAVKTPTGTIGIRGTHFLVKVDATTSQQKYKDDIDIDTKLEPQAK